MEINRLTITTESRILGDEYVRFGGEYIETCFHKGKKGALCLAIGVNYCCLLTLHLAGELEVDCNRIGLHLSLSRHCNEGEEGEDDVLIQICQNLSASFFSSVLLNWPTWKSCSMSLPSLLTKAPRGMAVKFSMVSNCFHSLLVI